MKVKINANQFFSVILLLLMLIFGIAVKANVISFVGDSASSSKSYIDTTVVRDFTMKDFDDKMLTLSSFRGKSYVILDFWASWCGPCRQFTYHLKDIYKQYHGKGLEVISISTDKTRSEWITGVITDGMGKWYNIYPPANKNYQNFNNDWGVKGVPTILLLDKEGKVMARYNGTDYKGNIPELNLKLAELLK